MSDFLDKIAGIGRRPRPKQKYVPPPGIPLLDEKFEKEYGPPVDHNDENARIFLRENPHVWVLMIQGTLKMIELEQCFSYKMLVEIARWYHLTSGTKDSRTQFKLSNSYTAHIARYCRHFYPIVNRYVEIHD